MSTLKMPEWAKGKLGRPPRIDREIIMRRLLDNCTRIPIADLAELMGMSRHSLDWFRKGAGITRKPGPAVGFHLGYKRKPAQSETREAAERMMQLAAKRRA